MSKKVMQKIVSIEKPTELSAEKVELGLQDDMTKLISDTDKVVADVELISDSAQRALNIAKSSGRNINSLINKIESKLNEVESAAKELGVDARNIKGYDKLSRISKQVLKNYNSYVQRANKTLRTLIMS